ncbi:MAG TPA: GAF domain-containing protein, partial [Phycisphaerae bacterium]|nr:GAF domain-containing protein [Phycisphaerae bacterium]
MTLFKRVRRFREWLVIVDRSGHLTLKHRTKFRISDDPNVCEGWAGKVWVQGTVLSIDNLPEITADSPPADLERYARLTGVSKEWIGQRLSKGRRLARSYLAIPVEVNGKPWGVVVLDSA